MDCVCGIIQHLARTLGPRLLHSASNSSDTYSASSLPGKMLNESVYELYKPDCEITVEIIFFHGLNFGDATEARAWTCGDGVDCWPQKWLSEQFQAAHILAVSYDVCVWKTVTRGRFDLELIVENLLCNLILNDSLSVGQGFYRPLVLVGHSVGGLIIKKLCMRAIEQMTLLYSITRDAAEHKKLKNFLCNVKGVFYFSTPHGGCHLSDLIRSSKKTSPILESIELLNKNAGRLDQGFNTLTKKYRNAWDVAGVVETHETTLGRSSCLVVDEASARIGLTLGKLLPVGEDHITVCQPKVRESSTYQFFVAFVDRILLKEREKLNAIQFLESQDKITVGLKSRVEVILKRLQTETMLGLYGMGGVGKSTLARAVLDACRHEFEFTCFIEDVKGLVKRETNRQQLKHQMLENLRYSDGTLVPKEDADWSTMKDCKVLLVIDDIDSEHQLEQIPNWRWFGRDSRVIATSRNEDICRRKFKNIHEVRCLDSKESLELFLLHAWDGKPTPPSLGEGHLQHILSFCGGVPLALEVVATTLYNESNEEILEGAIQRLKEGVPIGGDRDDRLLSCLRLSFDNLVDEEQKMFLDAAILFMFKRASKVLKIWKASWGPNVALGWQNLKVKCLVKEIDGKVWIHETLLMLARNIACPKHHLKSVQGWLRVGASTNAKELLTSHTQDPALAEGLRYTPYRRNLPHLVLSSESYTFTTAKFPNLRILMLERVDIYEDVVELPTSLVYLSWCNTNLVTCPVLFKCLQHLHILKLKRWRALEILPHELGNLTNLTHLDLKGCESLNTLPNSVSNLKKLRYLRLDNTGMVEVPECVGECSELETLSIASLPTSVEIDNTFERRDVQRLTVIPKSICNLSFLKSLDLSRTSVTCLPEAFGDLHRLVTLDLSGTKVDILPQSFGRLGNLKNLSLSSTPIETLPENFTQLGHLSTLKMVACKNFIRFPNGFGDMPMLHLLYAMGCHNLLEVPSTRGDQTLLKSLTMEYNGGHWGKHATFNNLVGLGTFSRLRELIVRAARGTTEMLVPLLQALQQLHELSFLKLADFSVVKRLPEDIGFILPKDIRFLRFTGWTHLEEVPESLGELTWLQELALVNCKSLVHLPESLGKLTKLESLVLQGSKILARLPKAISFSELPHLSYFNLCGCESMHTLLLPSLKMKHRSLDFSILINTWALLKNLFEHFGRFSCLSVWFYLKNQAILEAIPGEVSFHTSREHDGCPTHHMANGDGKSWPICKEKDPVTGEGALQTLEKLRPFYEDEDDDVEGQGDGAIVDNPGHGMEKPIRLATHSPRIISRDLPPVFTLIISALESEPNMDSI